jgi:ferritin-like metal-binding protein YciE
MAKASKTAKSKATTKNTTKAPAKDPMLKAFFIDELKDIYWAEKHLTKALPKMSKGATSEKLAQSLKDHLEQTKEHVTRLEQVFELLGEKARAKKCDAMAGIVEEGASILEDTEKGTATRDVGIILACQKVEHYEISTYGGLTTLAKILGLNDVADLLGQTLGEEKAADELLTEIAENHVNYDAAHEEED